MFLRSAVSSLSILLLTIGSTAATPAPRRLPEAEAIAELKAKLQNEAAERRFSGAVLVAKDGKPIFETACGYADREKRISNTVDTKFRFGSMGKMFTAVAVLQLVEAGRIKLDDPIAKYLPDYPNKDVAAVTIHQLLTHTGGTGDIFSPEYFEKRTQTKELSDYIALYGNRALKFSPGTKWEYSNYGYVLLGRIIEVVSGQNYYDFVRDHIFKAADMKSTDNLPEDQHVAGLSIAYTRDSGPHLIHVSPVSDGTEPSGGPPHIIMKGASPGPGPGASEDATGPLRSNEGTLPYRGTSAGGGYSTVGDLIRFVNALVSDKLLERRYTELLTSGKVETPRPGTKYAYGFEDQTTPDGIRFFGHGGGAPGMNGRLSVFPKSGYVVVVLSNLDPPAADNVARFIMDRLPAD